VGREVEANRGDCGQSLLFWQWEGERQEEQAEARSSLAVNYPTHCGQKGP
jgi:hypothetical protein